MRIKLVLNASNGNEMAPNYHYLLSMAIYKIFRFHTPEFNEYLKSIGLESEVDKFSLFSFALMLESAKFDSGRIVLGTPNATLYVSSPVIEEFIRSEVLHSFNRQYIIIAGKYQILKFSVVQWEIKETRDFASGITFKPLSPIVIRSFVNRNEKLKPFYYRFNDDQETVQNILNEDLRNKYKMVTGLDAGDRSVNFEWDDDMMNQRSSSGKKLFRKQTVRESKHRSTDVIANLVPFRLTGDTELIKIGYDCGFGDLTSLGFGLVKVITKHENKKLVNAQGEPISSEEPETGNETEIQIEE